LWLPALQKSSYLQYEVSDNGDVTIWPIDVSFDQANISKVVLSPNKRCTCFRAREYLSQCEHEILIVNGFDQRRFHHRWLNQWTYRKIVQELDFNENHSYTRLQNNSIGRYTKKTAIEVESNGDDDVNVLSQEDNPEDFSQEDDPEESSNDDNEDDQSTFAEDNLSQTDLSQSNDTGATTHINLNPWNNGQTFVQESSTTSLQQEPQETREGELQSNSKNGSSFYEPPFKSAPAASWRRLSRLPSRFEEITQVGNDDRNRTCDLRHTIRGEHQLRH
jgi:hypothetical protein